MFVTTSCILIMMQWYLRGNTFVIKLRIVSYMQFEPQPVLWWIWFEITFKKNSKRGFESYSNVNKQTMDHLLLCRLVEPEVAGIAGMIMAFCLVMGITTGVNFSLAVASMATKWRWDLGPKKPNSLETVKISQILPS